MKDFRYYLEKYQEVGYVRQVKGPILIFAGLPSVRIGEIVSLEDNRYGQVWGLNEDNADLVGLYRQPTLTGTRLSRTGGVFQVSLHRDNLLGRVVDPLGRSVGESFEPETFGELRRTDALPSGISTRTKIKSHLETGVNLVDLLVPIGKGQRELIIGDRKTGKTIFLLQTMQNQARKGMICIYAAIGKKVAEVKEVEAYFQDKKIKEKTVVVASFAQDPAGLVSQTPYTAMTIAEYFRDQGQDVLLILDDLTTHAKYYREISLGAKRFPGRESYPGDIFYVHASLLERAGNFVVAGQTTAEAAITCFPVAESIEGDLTGYIQTNLMAMTDGHIFFDLDYFTAGRRPAINPSLSVTRVGHQTQSQIRRDIHREITGMLTLFEKSVSFSRFSGELGLGVKVTLATGQKILDFLHQEPGEIFPANLQIVLFALLWVDSWHGSNDQMKADIRKINRIFDQDGSLRSHIDTLVADSVSFNDLLAKVRDDQTILALL